MPTRVTRGYLFRSSPTIVGLQETYSHRHERMLDHGLRDCLLEFAAALIGFWSIQLHDLRNTAAGASGHGKIRVGGQLGPALRT